MIQMQEWIEHTIERILLLSPQKILEIGCGTGLLLQRLLAYSTSYCASDFSVTAINYIKSQFQCKNKKNLPLQLIVRPANVFFPEENKIYDTVIINSVIQYFPNLEYLIETLEGAINTVKEGGHIFIGDVRSLKHLELFHFVVQLNSGFEISNSQLLASIKAQMIKEEELLISQEFFIAFAASHPRITDVTIQLKRGKYDNEMTQFRYDVILHVNKSTLAITPTISLNWQDQFSKFNDLVKYLKNNSPSCLFVKNVPNLRLAHYAPFINDDYTLIEKPFWNLLHTQSDEKNKAIDPEKIWNLSNFLPYEIEIKWADSDLIAMDVIFRHRVYGFGLNKKSLFSGDPSSKKMLLRMTTWGVTKTDFLKNRSQFSNDPTRNRWKQQKLTEIRHYLSEKLPHYMTPTAFIVLDSLPLTPNGKIDKHKLPIPFFKISQNCIILPKTQTEKELLKIWTEILGKEIMSTDANFFDIGGHSLLAMQLIMKIKKYFNVEITVQALFQASKVNKLSELIDKIRNFTFEERKRIKKSTFNDITLLKSSGTEPPIFLIHPIGGNIFCYVPFSKYLQINHPVYAFQDPSLTKKQILFKRVEEMASYYLNNIKKIQPCGPYYLGGYSMGGIIALEIAMQLHNQNESVQWLGLIDTWPILKNTDHFADDDFDYRVNLQYTEIQKKIKNTKCKNDRWLKLYQHHAKLLTSYTMPKFNFPIVLFKAADNTNDKKNDLLNCWINFTTANIEVYSVQGNHETILQEPYLFSLIQKFEESLISSLEYRINI